MLFIKYNIRFINKRCICHKMTQVADNRLQTFHDVCEQIGSERSYLSKAEILRKFFRHGINGQAFEGDTLLWVQMLLPGDTQRVYNLQNKKMLKLFSHIFGCTQQEMQLDLEQVGDISETLCKFFETSKRLPPQKKSTLYLQEVYKFLSELEQRTKEDEQSELLREICKQAMVLDLKIIIRLIKQDLRINAGARYILDAFGPLAYPAYQSSRDLSHVVQQFAFRRDEKPMKNAFDILGKKKADNTKDSGVQILTPISPMLANPCKSVEEAFKKCPGGLYSEIKYDGERVQIHKQNNEFKFFSRNLKPVMNHKVKRFRETIPRAFPDVSTMILDSEIILVDTESGDLLPFGTLGAHKKEEYAKAEVCLFVFDCIHFDGQDLTKLTFKERRKILEDNLKPLKSYVQLSESKFLKNPQELALMTAKVLQANLEGVVLKDPKGTYEPGKRKWLKIKKDYLFGGQMADTADLVVLGAWYGSGKKGGLMSIFLMGCYDQKDRLWKTVTKVHTGLDDSENEEVHEKVMKQMVRAEADHLPTWLLCKKSLVPDFIAKNPKTMPVWEITGAEFTKSEAHTAAGISIRFPRITRIREDKTTEQADNLERLQYIYEASKSNVKVDLLMAKAENVEQNDEVTNVCSKINLKTTPKKQNIKSEEKESNETTPKRKSTSLTEASKEKTTPKKVKKEESSPTARKDCFNNKLSFLKKESNCFDNLTAYFQTHINDLHKMRTAFELNGGTVSSDATKADLVFYADSQLMIDTIDFREKHKKSARHLNIKWLRDSLEAKRCQSYPIYAMVLKSTSY